MRDQAMEMCCRAVVLAVNSRDQADFAAAFGAVEALLGEERGEDLCAAMLVTLHENLRGLVEGLNREWEDEHSSARLAVLFKLLHQLVRLLTKTGQTLPFVGAGGPVHGGSGPSAAPGTGASAGSYSPFWPFDNCAVNIAKQQVDVGRRMDLASSVTQFLKGLALYDSDFQTRLINSAFVARSDLLAQAVVEHSALDPKPLFNNISARLRRLSTSGGGEGGAHRGPGEGGEWGDAGEGGAGDADARGGEVKMEWMFALHLLSWFGSLRSPRAHEMADTPLLQQLLDSIINPPPFPTDHAGVSLPTVLIITMAIAHLGPRLPPLIPTFLLLLHHLLLLEGEGGGEATGHAAMEHAQDETQRAGVRQGAARGAGRLTPSAAPAPRVMASAAALASAEAAGWAGGPPSLLRSLRRHVDSFQKPQRPLGFAIDAGEEGDGGCGGAAGAGDVEAGGSRARPVRREGGASGERLEGKRGEEGEEGGGEHWCAVGAAMVHTLLRVLVALVPCHVFAFLRAKLEEDAGCVCVVCVCRVCVSCVCVCVCVCVSPKCYILSVCISCFLSLSPALSWCVCVSLSVSLTLSLTLSLTPALTYTHTHTLSLSLSLSLSL